MILNKRIPFSYIFNMVKWDMFYVLLSSTVIGLITKFISILDISHEIPILPIQIPAFIGTAISLVLGFKLSQSYDRWWEARKIWGSITNDSRSVILQLINFTNLDKKGMDKNVVWKIAYRHIAWCYAMVGSLRKQQATEGLNSYLSNEEINRINRDYNIPLSIIKLNLKDIKELRNKDIISEYKYIQIDGSYVRLCGLMGQCERIKNTVFPKTYRLYLHYFIYVFLFTLSFALFQHHILLMIAMVFFISLPFFLLEKTAFLLQDPFENRPTDIPIFSISRNIEINIKQLIDDPNIPEPVRSDDFYIL